MFEKIMNSLPKLDSKNVVMGNTGYLDMFPWLTKPYAFVDRHNRPGFVAPFEVVEKETYSNGEIRQGKIRQGMVALFQRYTADNGVWVTGESHIAGICTAPFLNGPIQGYGCFDPEEVMERVMKGETVTIKYDGKNFPGSTYERRIRLMTPEEVTFQATRRDEKILL